MAKPLASPELRNVLRGFFDLLVRDQLVGYQLIREQLADRVGVETELDREVRERAESLDTLATVAQHLGLPDGQAPTVAQFDRVASELGLEWNSARVGRRWGRWRFAKDAFEGRRIRSTQHRSEASQRRGRRASTYSEEECLSALKQWLESAPPRVTLMSYNRWQRLVNERVSAGAPHVPSWATIRASLQIGFVAAVEVARGELSLTEARDIEARRGREREDWSRTEHHFVGVEWISRRLGRSRQEADLLARRKGFPRPVVRFERRRAWLQEDLEAYFQDKPLGDRDREGLEELYLTSGQVAAMIGRATTSLSMGYDRLPQPAGMVSFRLFFLRSEVEQWMRDNPQRVGRGGYQRARRSRSAAAV